MLDPLNQRHIALMDRLKRSRKAAFIILMLERLSAALWRSLTWIGFFVGLWLLCIPQFFGQNGPCIAWLAFTGGLAWLLWRDTRGLKPPDIHEIDRRLEKASALPHRPLAILDDTLSNPRQALTRTLWSSGKEHALAAIGRIRLPFPEPLLAARDPAAFRIFVILLVMTGLGIAGPQASLRVKQGLFPFHGGKEAVAAQQDVSIWITPPDYTGLKTIVIPGGHLKKAIDVPAGSTLKARVAKGWTTPKLVMGKNSIPFTALDDGNWNIETSMTRGSRLIIRQGLSKKADISYNYKDDLKPVITLKNPPKVLAKGQWQFDATVQDDYGITNLTLHMSLDPSITDKPLGKPVTDTRPTLTPGGMPVEIQPVYDMTWHSWAGLPVIVTLEATDHLGQSATTPPLKITLPARSFRHPVAVAINGLRKRLIWTPDASAANVAYELEKIMASPDAYNGDIPVFLSLRSAASRMIYDPGIPSAEAVVAQLWDTAVKVEDGNLPLAARDFQEAKQELEKLLSDPKATPEQIAQAMEKLRTALGQYLQETFRELQKKMAENGIKPLTENQIENIISPEDLQAFLDQLQAQALTGDKQSARDMLSQLGHLADSLDPSMNAEVPKDLEFMSEAMKEMQDIADAQKELMERTGKDPKDSKNQHDQQQALSDRMEKLMLKADEALGKIPENMQKAYKEMRDAADKLNQSKPSEAIPHQQTALDQLKEGQGQMAQQMQQRVKQLMAMAMNGGGLDPLGHRNSKTPSALSGSNIKIPDQAERKKVQDIMRLLRKKSGDFSRPDYELEYYRRLMQQF